MVPTFHSPSERGEVRRRLEGRGDEETRCPYGAECTA